MIGLREHDLRIDRAIPGGGADTGTERHIQLGEGGFDPPQPTLRDSCRLALGGGGQETGDPSTDGQTSSSWYAQAFQTGGDSPLTLNIWAFCAQF